jgi:hypothetical protein
MFFEFTVLIPLKMVVYVDVYALISHVGNFSLGCWLNGAAQMVTTFLAKMPSPPSLERTRETLRICTWRLLFFFLISFPAECLGKLMKKKYRNLAPKIPAP